MKYEETPEILTLRKLKLKDLAEATGIPYRALHARRTRARKKGVEASLEPLQTKYRGLPLEELEGMTQAEAARHFGVDKKTIYARLKSGKVVKNGEWVLCQKGKKLKNEYGYNN